MKEIIVTTSWDDASKLDLKVADLLKKYGIKGTFYVAPGDKRFSLSEKEIKQLDEFQEIGAHSFSHPRLTELSHTEAEKEIVRSKEHLEGVLGKEIKMFCYPFGKFNEEIKGLVKDAGFLGARTVGNFKTHFPNDPFEFGATVHVYPFPFRKKDANHYFFLRPLFDPIQQCFWQILKLRLPFKSFLSCPGLSKGLFDYVLKNGSVYHLWAHSWEIEKYGMWEELEEIFKYIAHRKDILYLTNGEVLEKSVASLS